MAIDPRDPLARLLPVPRSVERLPGRGPSLVAAPRLVLEDGLEAIPSVRHTAERVQGPAADTSFLVRVALIPGLRAEAYRLHVSTEVVIEGTTPTGVVHGLRTLTQLIAAHRAVGAEFLTRLHVDDEPMLGVRGLMLDVSRNRVPTLASLLEIVDWMAELKLNQLQLYTEHAFAYVGHAEVWRGISPLHPEDIRCLDEACALRGIELVPNQNSLGHMHRWLKHDRYRPLAERPEGIEHPFSIEVEPFSLNPTNPGSLELVCDLYDQLIPLFRSRQMNVGLDEAFDLGTGGSKAVAESVGRGEVYLRFLQLVHRCLAARDRRMMVWGDILLNHPELVSRLPRDLTLLCWGYEADHPFQRELEVFSQQGCRFLACPGTSTWNSLVGRLQNARANIQVAATATVTAGGAGLLLTDWGDNGHLQPWIMSLPPIALGSAAAWNPLAVADDDALAAALEVSRVPPGWGRLLVTLAQSYLALGVEVKNGTVPFRMLTRPVFNAEQFWPSTLPQANFEAVADIARAVARSAEDLPGGRTVDRVELRSIAHLLEACCVLGAARRDAGVSTSLARLADRRAIAEQLRAARSEFEDAWLLRSRVGGLAESLGWLDRALAVLEAPCASS